MREKEERKPNVIWATRKHSNLPRSPDAVNGRKKESGTAENAGKTRRAGKEEKKNTRKKKEVKRLGITDSKVILRYKKKKHQLSS